MVEVWQGGKICVRRYGAIIGPKRPIFGIFRKIYQENLGPGLLSGRRREAALGSGPSDSCCTLAETIHIDYSSGPTLLQGRHPGIASEGQALLPS